MYGFAVIVGLVLLFALWPVNKKSEGGYLNSVLVQFPKDRYTFLVSKEEMAGRTIITDNLWGYRYPSMEPLTPAKRGEFMTAYEHTDWIKAAVHVRNYTPSPSESEKDRNAKMCFNQSIQRKLQPGQSNFTRGQDVYIQERELYFGNLKRLSAPDKPEYQDPKQFGLPIHIYWDDSSGNACTLIMCKKYPANIEGQNCQQLFVDPATGLEFSMRYDSKLLPHWQDIQNKTVAIFDSFSKKEMAQAEEKQ